VLNVVKVVVVLVIVCVVTDVVDTLVVVTLVVESVVTVIVVVVTVMVVVCDDSVEVMEKVLVFVRVVQKLHVLSHIPAYSPQVSQKSDSQGSTHGWLKLVQVRLQNSSGFRLIWRHGVALLSVMEETVLVSVVVVSEPVVPVIVLVVSEPVVAEVLVVMDVPEVGVSVAVVMNEQISQVMSHMWAPSQVGQNTVGQVQLI
jgi:hypothetical protein